MKREPAVAVMQNQHLKVGTPNPEKCWQAVLARDGRADSQFVYAVRSTGIYCRPSCPSRRPHREQVAFFSRIESAVEAGFRPCRRCRPGEGEPQVELVGSACRYIEANLEGDLSLAALGEKVNISPFHLQRTFKRVLGITPRQYAQACRLGQVKTQLRQGAGVTEALYEAGYSSSSRLYEQAPARLGMTPATYRRGGAGMQIGYIIVACPLGRLLVGATQKGICVVSLGDADVVLEAALRAEYPAAEIRQDEAGFGEWVSALMEYLNGRQSHLDLPLDLQATAFQWRVWEALQHIPYGSTRSYSQIARALGQPTAARAVAHACATNPVSLVIPCHRVLREDGSLGGYRWGLERKRSLLAQERATTSRFTE